ncbi:hypothetical protein [Fibrella aquatica]|uniref:hypothetical protein n=1 Tax=Fibrella aquatica TaxID=3242487 RepID=UPI0035230F3C
MHSFFVSVVLIIAISIASVAGPIRQGRRNQPTKLVHFEAGIMITGSGKLRVNVDKQLGGQVYIQLMDRRGSVCYTRTLYADEELIRLDLDLSRLPSNQYVLKISNGLEMITRDVKIEAIAPVEVTRSVTLQ